MVLDQGPLCIHWCLSINYGAVVCSLRNVETWRALVKFSPFQIGIEPRFDWAVFARHELCNWFFQSRTPQAESILTCTLSDMIYGSCDHWHLNHLQSEVLHGDKNNLIRWLTDMRRDREFLEDTVIIGKCGCNFFMGNTHCSINDFLRVWFRHGNFRLSWKSPSSVVPLNPRVREEPSNANAARKSITICCSVARCHSKISFTDPCPKLGGWRLFPTIGGSPKVPTIKHHIKVIWRCVCLMDICAPCHAVSWKGHHHLSVCKC